MSKRDLYYKMIKLIEQEEEVIKRVRKAEEEVCIIHKGVFNVVYCHVCRLVTCKLVVNKKNFQAILKLVFMISKETKNPKYIENYW